MQTERTLYQATVGGSRGFCAGVVVEGGRVVDSAPILAKFRGLHVSASQTVPQFVIRDGEGA